MTNSEVTCIVKKILSEKKVKSSIYRLQIVQWNTNPPTLEKREYWVSGNIEKTGKAKGLTLEDFNVIATNAVEVTTLLK